MAVFKLAADVDCLVDGIGVCKSWLCKDAMHVTRILVTPYPP